MAIINYLGNIIARCPDCKGSKSTFEWRSSDSGEYGSVDVFLSASRYICFRLFRCAGCGRGGLGAIEYRLDREQRGYPGSWQNLYDFYPESAELVSLPHNVPDDIQKEFREAEKCIGHKCYRAASGLFRSVLEKTMRASGYIDGSLANRIDTAANDGILTETRRGRAHDEIRVLGNDVLHDDWREISEDEVELSRHYAQRILEDFYDDRDSVLAQLREAGRTPREDREESA